MPDFFDRLLARDARLGSGSGVAARTADLEQRAQVTRTFPSPPMMFEWSELRLTEQVAEVDAVPAPPTGGAGTSMPVAASWPTPPHEVPGSPPPMQPTPTGRGPETVLWPRRALLASQAVQVTPTETAVGPASGWRAEPPGTPPGPGRRGRGPGADVPRRGDPGTPASGRLSPPREAAATASRPSVGGVTLPVGQGPRHASSPPPEQVVQVRIGRIEVRPAETAEPRRPSDRAPGRPGPELSLERFLAGEDGGR